MEAEVSLHVENSTYSESFEDQNGKRDEILQDENGLEGRKLNLLY